MTRESESAPKTSSSTRHGMIHRVVSRRPRFLPPEFHEHSRAARKEVLLAVRSLIDARIKQLDEAKQDPASSKKTQRVKVE